MFVYWQLLWQYLPETFFEDLSVAEIFFEGLSLAEVTVGLHDSRGAGTPGKSWADKKFVIVCQFSTKIQIFVKNLTQKFR